MKKLAPVLLILICVFAFETSAQSLSVKPSEDGKATIYFVRTPGTGAWINFRFFEKGDYLGKFQGTGYIRHEAEPGQTFLWVKAENLDVIEANLKPNGIYIIQVRPTMGAFSSAVKFKEVDFSDEGQMKRLEKVLSETVEVRFTEAQLAEDMANMQEVIKSSMKKITKKRRKMKNVINITPDMDYNSDQ